jgi:hypothetical protein
MIFPTLIAAIYIMWRTRQMISELAHNLAIIFWITANSMWMILEFTGTDELYKNYCLIPFFAGLVVLFYYYVLYAPAHKRRVRALLQVESADQ